MFLTFFAASLVMYSKYNEDLKQSVRDSIRYIQNGVEKMGDSYLDKKLDEASAARITLLDGEGNVLFDSLENPAMLENHSNRPEFIEAEKNGYAETMRYSETLSKQNFYCAVKLFRWKYSPCGKYNGQCVFNNVIEFFHSWSAFDPDSAVVFFSGEKADKGSDRTDQYPGSGTPAQRSTVRGNASSSGACR